MKTSQSTLSSLPLPLKIIGGLAIILLICIIGAIAHVLIVNPDHQMRQARRQAQQDTLTAGDLVSEAALTNEEASIALKDAAAALADAVDLDAPPASTSTSKAAAIVSRANQNLAKIEAEMAADKLRMEDDIAQLDKVTSQIQQLQKEIGETKARNEQYQALVARLEQLEAQASAPSTAEETAQLQQEIRVAQEAAAAAVAGVASNRTLTAEQQKKIDQLIELEREELRDAE